MAVLTSYRTGTVSLTSGSNIVSGVGTSWIVSGIRVGDVFWANGLSVAVESVTDSQTLVLAFPWSGETLNGVAYEVRYISDAERTLAATQTILAALKTKGVSALTEVEPNANTMPYFTGLAEAATTPLTEFSRMMLAGASMSDWQQIIGLVAQSNNLDSVIGKVLTVGGFGIGTISAPLIENINSFTIPAGFYKVDARITTGVLPPSSDIADSLLVLHPTASQTMQVYLGMTENGRNFIRKSNSDGTWAPWRSIMLDFEFGTGPGSSLDADTVDGYHASDFMLTTDYTEGGMLALIKAVDGAGSGLDADLLDGLHASSFVRTTGNETVSGDKTFSDIITFSSAARLNVNADEQLQVGYNRNVTPTIQFYNGLDKRGFIVDNNLTGMTLTSGAGGSLFIGSSGVIEINGEALPTNTYIDNKIAELVDSSPEALNTLNELSAALGDDPNFATTVTNQIGTKLNTSAYTAADVLNKIKTVDGTGSGLDADLLDGQQGSYYASVTYVDDTVSALGGGATAADVLAKMKTVDGDGSGLDADLLDGQHASYFQRAFTDVSQIELGLNTSTSVVYIDLHSDGNSATDYNARIVRYPGVDGNYGLNQTGNGYVFIDGGSNLVRNGNTIWHAGNDGAGSGLDADLLDGKHADDFANSTNSIVGGNGLAGGGTLAANRTITLGTPGSITATSTNSVTTTSHTHALSEGTIRDLISEGNVGQLGTYAFLQLISGYASPGSTIAGAGLRYSNATGEQGGTVSGTWRCMGAISNSGSTAQSRTTLFLRVA